LKRWLAKAGFDPAKLRHPVRNLLFQLRTEGGSPARMAGAVGLGVLIGCSPFYGFHLLLCILLGRLFRVNLLLTYLAAHVSVPGLWPLLVLGEIQVGRRLRGAPFLSLHLEDLKRVSPWRYGADLLLGSAVVGVVLAVVLSFITFQIAKRRRKAPEIHALIEQTARRYVEAGIFHWEFVRGKLRHDPVYFHLLREGVLPAEGRLVDLGCGRGIVPALLLTARELADRGEYPPGWAAPPRLALHGIESSPKVAAAARQALGEEATVETRDLATAAVPAAAVVLLLDVLHYLPAALQEDLLRRVAEALELGGLLLIRDADAAGGLRFFATRVQERLCALARRHWRQRFHYRSAADWGGLLGRLGLEVDVAPMAEGTPYSNVLIAARQARFNFLSENSPPAATD
jgi:uncharacterized protein (DUF2062 family)/trans-aconitate methyltransferase